MNNPLVSVVIPLYNKEEYILQALQSIQNQTLSSWECIIIDDGSTDSSVGIVSKFISQNQERFSLIHQKNSGPSTARNNGIKLAKGKYVAFLDADDMWLPTKLITQVDFMEKNQNVILTLTNYVVFDYTTNIKLKAIRARNPINQIRRWLDMRGFGGLVESTGILRRDALGEGLYFDNTMQATEGLDFTLKWFLFGQVEIVQDYLTLYRISKNQLHTNENLIKENVEKVAKKYPFLVQDEVMIRSLHRAYFRLSGIRAKGLVTVLCEVFIRFLKLDFPFISMLFSIVYRNVSAKFLGLMLRRKVIKYLAKVTQQLL
jgi:glycosyltransferase involved in cell wall biosynthesis